MPILYESTDDIMAKADPTPLILAGGSTATLLLAEGIMRGLEKATGRPTPIGYEKTLIRAGALFYAGLATYGLVQATKAVGLGWRPIAELVEEI